MLRIGPSGNSLSFYEQGHKRTKEAAAWLAGMGLNAYEYSFGRGVRISEEAAAEIAAAFAECDVEISSHAPYYTNFANPDSDMIEKSVGYIRQTLIAENMFGGKRTVFHPASCGKSERKDAVARAKYNIAAMMDSLGDVGFDFGHINSYTRGGIKGYDDYKRIIDYTAEKLDDKRAQEFHVHFSKIMYGEKGELKHLTFADDKYGPNYEGLAKLIDEYKLRPFIICESDGTQAEDALAMKRMHSAV